MEMNGDLSRLLDVIYDIREEAARIPFVEEAIRIADQANDSFYSFDLRMDLIRYAVFNGQILKALPAFAWCLSYVEKGEGNFSVDDILWEYKWINSNISYFYEIPCDKIDRMYDDFKSKLIENGYSLNSYYYLLMCRGVDNRDQDTAKKAYVDMQKYDRDNMSDCKACVQDGLVQYAVFIGDYNLALKFANPILKGKIKCAEVPHNTYGVLLLPAFFNGDIDLATEFEEKGYRLIHKNKEYVHIIGNFLIYYAFTNPRKALRRYAKFISWSFNPYMSMGKKCDFFESMAAMFTVLIHKGYNKSKFILPAEFELYNDSGVYDLNELLVYYTNKAQDITSKFDKRNGNINYSSWFYSFMDKIKVLCLKDEKKL